MKARRKGMSQTLSLIVAATVLLMAALTVIFLTSSSLGSFGQGAQGERCAQAMNLKCQGGGTVSLPGSCVSGGKLVPSYPGGQYDKSSGDSASPGERINCAGSSDESSEEESSETEGSDETEPSGPGECPEGEGWISEEVGCGG